MIALKDKVLLLLQDINEEIPNDITINLLEEGIIDSFDIANIVASLEFEFNIEFDAEDIVPENFCSVENIINLLNEKGGIL